MRCVCVFFTRYLKTEYLKKDAATNTKLDTEMFHEDPRKFVCFGFKRSKVKVTSHKNIAGVGLRTVVSAGCF